MAGHSSTREARLRAAKKFYEKNREKVQMQMRQKYYEDDEARQKKINKAKQRVYEEGTIRFIRLLFVA